MTNDDTDFYTWLLEVERIYVLETGYISKIMEEDFEHLYDEGLTPFQAFKQTHKTVNPH